MAENGRPKRGSNRGERGGQRVAGREESRRSGDERGSRKNQPETRGGSGRSKNSQGRDGRSSDSRGRDERSSGVRGRDGRSSDTAGRGERSKDARGRQGHGADARGRDQRPQEGRSGGDTARRRSQGPERRSDSTGRGRPSGARSRSEEPVPERPSVDIWIDEGPSRDKGDSTSSAGRSRRKPSSRSTGRKVGASLDRRGLVDLVGEVRAERLVERIESAADAYVSGRFEEARRTLSPIVTEAPDYIESRELYGLALYRLGRWKQAAQQLEAFVELSGGSTEQHPVLADCKRALKQYSQVTRLWNELKEASPSSELVTEGRIVAAGALADQGRLADAIRMLSQGFRFPKRPALHHLRRAYALADLYERSGDLPQARMLFGRVAHFDDEYLDAAERLENLS